MSKKDVQVPVSIDIDDLTEVVGGFALNVTPLTQTLIASSPLGTVALDSGLNLGARMSTVMCPSSKIVSQDILVNPAIRG